MLPNSCLAFWFSVVLRPFLELLSAQRGSFETTWDCREKASNAFTGEEGRRGTPPSHQSASTEQLLSGGGMATQSWDTLHAKQARVEPGRDAMRRHQVSEKEARILFPHVKQAKANLLYSKNIKPVTVKPNEHDPGPSPCDLGSPSGLV